MQINIKTKMSVNQLGNEPTPRFKPKNLPPYVNFINAGLSGMAATCVVHPMDVVKNTMQMSKTKPSFIETVAKIFSTGGATKLYAGLSAGLVRQATYTTARLGTFNQLGDMYRLKYEKTPGFGSVTLMAVIAGSCSAFVGTPAEVALVRMTSDGRLPPDQRRNYKNVVDAFTRIIKEEGIAALWKGTVPTMGRSAVVNVSQLVTYSQAKILINTQVGIAEGIPLHFAASMVSGIITAFNSMPFDIIKTRIQNMTGMEKTPGMVSLMTSIARNEGIGALWKGFWPTYCRIGPHTVITLIVNEQIAQFYRELLMK